MNLQLFSANFCAKTFPYYYGGMLCAGDSMDGKYNSDPCRGDTGGPLICNDELTGIVSWKVGCGRSLNPSIYTGVYYHKDWIVKAMNSGQNLQIYSNLILFFLFLCILYYNFYVIL